VTHSVANNPARRKELGAFYTPPGMVDKLVRWAVRTPQDRVLDPSFGGLVFLSRAARRLVEVGLGSHEAANQLYGVEVDEHALASAGDSQELRLPAGHLVHKDFFAVTPGGPIPPCTAVVGNPPYVRYQGWDGRQARQLCAAEDVDLSRRASTWAPFLVHSAAFVAKGGRLAMVLPAEILHSQYAAGIPEFLGRSFGRLQLAVFDERVFPGALGETVLLFAERRGETCRDGIEILERRRLDDLDVEVLDHEPPQEAALWHGRGKLLSHLLPHDTRQLYKDLAERPEVSLLGAYGSVDIGAVTGANAFFLLGEHELEGIPAEDLRLCVNKAVHIRGARLTNADIRNLLAAGHNLRLLYPRSSIQTAMASSIQRRLRRGRRIGIHHGYKCRVRKPWWRVPLPTSGVPKLLLTYCTHVHPRLVLNEAGVLHTNTIHSFSPLDGAPLARTLAAGFVNSLTLLSAELVGRSYGGGVLKLEPTEAERLLIPPLYDLGDSLLDEVDPLLRAGRLSKALDLVDPLVLGDGLGLGAKERQAIRAGAAQLRQRRHARGRRPRASGE
jgi:adenine-specific DNA-methyltransferase